MRFHRTSHNLVVVDFNSVILDILNDYYTDLKTRYGGILEYELSEKDVNKLKLYYTFKWITRIQAVFGNKRDIVFYIQNTVIDDLIIQKHAQMIAKNCAVLLYQGTYKFDVIQGVSGETIELINHINDFRFSYDFSKMSPRKTQSFIVKHGLQAAVLGNPAI